MQPREPIFGKNYESYPRSCAPPFIYQQDPRVWLKTTSNLRLSDYIKSITVSHDHNVTKSDLDSKRKNWSRRTDQPFLPTSGNDQVHVIPTEGSTLPGFQTDDKAKRELRERYFDKMLNEDVPMRDGMNYPYYRAYLDSLPDSTRHPSYYDSTFRYFPYTKSFYENSRVTYATNYEHPDPQTHFSTTAQNDELASSETQRPVISVNHHHRQAEPALLLPKPPKVQTSVHQNLFSVSQDVKEHFRAHFLGMIGAVLPEIRHLVENVRTEVCYRPGLSMPAFIAAICPYLLPHATDPLPAPGLSKSALSTLKHLKIDPSDTITTTRTLLGKIGAMSADLADLEGHFAAFEHLLAGFGRVFEGISRGCRILVRKVGETEFTLEELLRESVLREIDSITFEEFLSLLHANNIRFDHKSVQFLFNLIDEKRYGVINCDAVHRFIENYNSYEFAQN